MEKREKRTQDWAEPQSVRVSEGIEAEGRKARTGTTFAVKNKMEKRGIVEEIKA